MYTLDWGHITPESFNLATNDVTYVFNHDLGSEEKMERTVRFIIGRLQYYDLHLPAKPRHIVKIDARGQSLNKEHSTALQSQIESRYNKKNPLVVEIILE